MKRFFVGIFCTVRGFFDAVISDIYLRLEIAVLSILIYFGNAFGLDRTGWAILAIAAAAAVGAQLIYAGVRRLIPDDSEDKTARAARFMMSAGSAVIAAGALAVCVCLFYDKEKIKTALLNLRYTPDMLTHLTVLFVIAVLFVAWFERPKWRKRGEKNEK